MGSPTLTKAGALVVQEADAVTLNACPPGLFVSNGTLGFKTEYGAMELVGSPHQPGPDLRWTVGKHPDAYVVDSGEYFWGGTSKHEDRAGLMVHPAAAVSVKPAAGGSVAEQRDEAIRVAHGLVKTVAELIQGLPEYLDRNNLTDEERIIDRADVTLKAAVSRLATMPEEVPEGFALGEAEWLAELDAEKARDTMPSVADIAEAIERTGQRLEYSMTLIRLVDGISTYKLEIDGKTHTFTDSEENDWNGQAALYAHLREVRQTVQAAEVLALFKPESEEP